MSGSTTLGKLAPKANQSDIQLPDHAFAEFVAAFADTEHLEKSVMLANKEVSRITKALHDMGLSTSDSFRNAVFADVGQDARRGG